LARAKKTDCEKLISSLGGRRTSGRELERLYVSWKSGDADRRRRILQHPLLFLKAAEELKSEPDKRAGNDIQRLFEDMEILDAVSGRARRRVRGMRVEASLPDTLIESWRFAQSSFAALAVAMEKRIHAGHGNQDGDFASQG
jgi:hypothetical protein